MIIVCSIMGIIIGLLVWATTGELVWGAVCGMMCAALKTDDKYIFKLRSLNGSLVTIATTRRILAKVIQWTVGAGVGAGVGAAVGAAVGTLTGTIIHSPESGLAFGIICGIMIGFQSRMLMTYFKLPAVKHLALHQIMTLIGGATVGAAYLGQQLEQ